MCRVSQKLTLDDVPEGLFFLEVDNSISYKLKDEVKTFAQLMQVHRVIVQLWKDKRGRVRMITVGVSSFKDLIKASKQAINRANGRLKPVKLGAKSGYCSYLDNTKIKLTAKPEDCIDIGVYSDSLFSGGKTKFYSRDHGGASCSLKPGTSAQYLEKDLDKINEAIDDKIKNLIEEVDPEDEDEEDEGAVVVVKKPPKYLVGAKNVLTCSVCGYKCGSQGHMKRHKRVHSGERPFVCMKCPARPGFKYKHNLTRHQQTGCRKRGGTQKISRAQLQLARANVVNVKVDNEKPVQELTKEEALKLLQERENENSSLKNVVSSLKNEVSSLKNENSSLKNENSSLKNENSSLKNENSSLKNENSSLKNEGQSSSSSFQQQQQPLAASSKSIKIVTQSKLSFPVIKYSKGDKENKVGVQPPKKKAKKVVPIDFKEYGFYDKKKKC